MTGKAVRGVVAAALAMLALEAPAGAAPLGKTGRWITDAGGRVVTVHGYNMVAKLPPYTAQSVGFGEDDARLLAGHGYNLVRLGIMWSAVEPRPGVYDDRYLGAIAESVDQLGRHGIYTLVDFHQDGYSESVGGQGFPEWTTGGASNEDAAWDRFWANAAAPDGVALWDRFVGFWRHVARRFADNPWVIGYDLMNEPVPGSQLALCANPVVCPHDETLGRFYRHVIPRIREADREHLIFYEPNILAGGGGAQNIDHGGDPRAALSFHNYCTLTALTLGSFPEQERQPICAVTEDATFAAAERQAARRADALVMTEFGSVPNVEEVTRVAAGADARRLGWTEWTYHNTGHTNFAGEYSIVRDPRKAPEGDNVNDGLLRALTRPYPQAVAGVPESWSFDAASRAFALHYTTRRADGRGTFPAGSTTRIAMPRLHYSEGYSVEARGAQLATPARSRLLDLRSEAGADAVTVRITPGAGRFPRVPARLRVIAFRKRGAGLVMKGRLTLPEGTDATDGCTGQVRVRTGRLRRTTRLRADCAFRVVLQGHRRRAAVRFAGNDLLLPVRANAVARRR